MIIYRLAMRSQQETLKHTTAPVSLSPPCRNHRNTDRDPKHHRAMATTRDRTLAAPEV